MSEPDICKAVRNERARLARVRRRLAAVQHPAPEAGLPAEATLRVLTARLLPHPPRPDRRRRSLAAIHRQMREALLLLAIKELIRTNRIEEYQPLRN
jgi:hypothetical protein